MKGGKNATTAKKHAFRLLDVARRIEPATPGESSELPAGVLSQLKDSCTHIEETHRIFRKWGFDQKLPHNNRMNILLLDPTGNGETLAAEFVAANLDMPLYVIDLGTLINKYIGETAKGLEGIFDSEESRKAILFFGEADALFGKRSHTSDASDHYANAETEYLLQRLEQFPGIVIVASRLYRSQIVDFASRMPYVIEFPTAADEPGQKSFGKVLRGFRRVLGKV